MVDDERKIFPALLNQFEREVLNRLSAESRVSRSEVVRTLILREMASKHLTLTKRETNAHSRS